MTSFNYDVIFRACDADQSGSLDLFETQYALQAMGLYPEKEYLKRKINELNFTFPLSLTDFQQIVEALKNSECTKGLCTVPYARRGLTLGQLKSLHCGLIETGWLQSICNTFNIENKKEIQEGKKFQMKANLYAMDQPFVQATTNENEAARDELPEDVLQISGIPNSPERNCSFAQLMNPNGLEVDYFVSHYWGHPFKDTMKALTNFAESVYREVGKNSPDDVVFWICLYALNQHQAKEEVGETPEEGPFNAALANSKYGAVMVVDIMAEPMRRIWCLFEVSRAKYFDKNFQLIVDEGMIENASVETLKAISTKLMDVCAFKANSSDDLDKLKILYRILDPKWKNLFGASFQNFLISFNIIDEGYFKDFDAHVGSLIGTPLLAAGLKLKSKEVCLESIGMGAIVTVDQLTQLNVTADMKVKTRYGMCGLPIIFARLGRLDELEYVLGLGGDVNEKDDDNEKTALHWAALKGETEVVTFLLNRGAAVGDEDGDGFTELLLAAMTGKTEIIKLLLDHGSAVDEKTDKGTTALIVAAMNGHSGVVTVLLDAGADIDHKDGTGETALIHAATSGHLGAATLLLDRGADIEAKGKDGRTALHQAAACGHPNVLSLLLDRGADIDAENDRGTTPLQAAIVDMKNDQGTALLDAVSSGHLRAVTVLLDRGADIEAKNKDGDTAFHFATCCGHPNVISLLLDRGADINGKIESFTALQIAVMNKDTQMVEILLDRGADINAKSNGGITALQYAINSKHTETIEILRERGAVDEHTKLLLTAAMSGRSDIVEFLLDAGADIDHKNENGMTALINAAGGGHLGVVTVLLDKGADIKSKNKDGHTALHYAAGYGHPNVLSFLLDRGADINVKDDDGDTPLQAAIKQEQRQIVEILRERDAK